MNYTELVSKMEGWVSRYGLDPVKRAIAYNVSHSFCDYSNKDFCHLIVEGIPPMGITPKEWIEDSLAVGNEGKLYSEPGGDEEGDQELLNESIQEIEDILSGKE